MAARPMSSSSSAISNGCSGGDKLTESYKLPSRQLLYISSPPIGVETKYHSRWAIGEFLFQLSSLETEITEWISSGVRALHPVYMHVIVRDVNFYHKIRIVDFLIKKKMRYEGDWKIDKSFLISISEIRNSIAHGAIENHENGISISMPSKDNLIKNKRKIITIDQFCDYITKMSHIMNRFDKANTDHVRNMLEKSQRTSIS
jgi:hypothetical protein